MPRMKLFKQMHLFDSQCVRACVNTCACVCARVLKPPRGRATLGIHALFTNHRQSCM